jgi:hypothetical protein
MLENAPTILFADPGLDRHPQKELETVTHQIVARVA